MKAVAAIIAFVMYCFSSLSEGNDKDARVLCMYSGETAEMLIAIDPIPDTLKGDPVAVPELTIIFKNKKSNGAISYTHYMTGMLMGCLMEGQVSQQMNKTNVELNGCFGILFLGKGKGVVISDMRYRESENMRIELSQAQTVDLYSKIYKHYAKGKNLIPETLPDGVERAQGEEGINEPTRQPMALAVPTHTKKRNPSSLIASPPFGHVFGVGPLVLMLIDRSDWVSDDGSWWDWCKRGP